MLRTRIAYNKNRLEDHDENFEINVLFKWGASGAFTVQMKWSQIAGEPLDMLQEHGWHF